MTPLSRYRVPKIAQHAAFGHMNDYDLEIQSLVVTDQVVGARLRAGLRTICTEAYWMASVCRPVTRTSKRRAVGRYADKIWLG
jgi:hypothetical protein